MSEENKLPDLSEVQSAGDIRIGEDVYRIVFTHGHDELKVGDRVVMRDHPKLGHTFIRINDLSIQNIQADGQYVLVKKESE